MIQWLDNLCSPVLDLLQSVHILLLLGSLELDTIELMRPHRCWAERKDHLFHPSDKALPIAAQEAHWPSMETHCSPMISSFAKCSSLQRCFPAGQPSAFTDTWGYSSPDAGLLISLCWALLGSCWPISPICSGPSEWQHCPLVYQLPLSVFLPSINLLMVQHRSLSSSLIKRFNSLAAVSTCGITCL